MTQWRAKKPEETYSEEEIKARLEAELPHWYYEDGWIRRKFKTGGWKGTLMVVNTVGHLAEAAWHHPDLTVSYAFVIVKLVTHSAKGITDKDLTFSTTGLFHAYGFGNSLTMPYWVGASTILHAGRHTPATVLDTIEKRRPTLFFSAPTLYNAILNFEGAKTRDLSSIKHCVAAAEALPAETWRRWKDTYGLTILDGVGSTEMLHI